MSIIRTEHNKNNPYVMLNKSALEEPTMSFEAKGMWAYLMSRPDNWNVSVAHLAKTFRESKSRKLGEEGILVILNELIKFGYCQREQPKKEGGKFGRTDYRMFEHPMQMVFHSEKHAHNECEPQPSQPVTAVPPTNKQCIKTNIDKDNVLRKGGNVDNPKPPKKTMPSFKSKEKTLDASRRWKLTPDQTETFNFLDGDHIDTEEGTKAYWAKNYSLQRLIEVYEEAKASKGVRSIGAYMQKLLKSGAVVAKGHATTNKDFAEYFKDKTGWQQLEIMKKYIKVPCGNGSIEIDFNMQPKDFQETLMNKHANRC